MQTAPMRVFLGFVAAAIAVLTFHQISLESNWKTVPARAIIW